MSAFEALSRTTRLINQEYFDGEADEEAITKGLLATTVRLVGDEANLTNRGGQAAFVTAFQLIARMGIGIELTVPEVELVAGIAPLRGGGLRAALLELGADLIPGAVVREGRGSVDLTFVFGDARCSEDEAVYINVGNLECRLTKEKGERERLRADYPLGGLAAGAAAAAIALDAGLPRIAQAAGRDLSSRRRPSTGPPVEVDLGLLFPTVRPGVVELGRIDAISGGAVTNALVAVLEWLPGLVADMRILDDDVVDLSNLNRCPQFRRSDVGDAKTAVLSKAGGGLFAVTGVEARLSEESRSEILPLAGRVAVGVDNSSSRWFVQQQWPDHLYVGATNNREAVLTTHHPGEPCAGCAHPDPVEPGEMVPTISFVSFWAGLLQACALLAEADTAQAARRVVVYPFGLGEKLWSMASALPRGARCAIGCPASGTIEIVRQGTPSASAPPHHDGAAGRGGGPDYRRGLWRE